MIAFSTSPYIATTFAGPAAAQAYYEHSTWRWAFGTFAILTPAISLPFLYIFWHNQQLAKRQGVLLEKREASGRRWWQSVQHYLIEFDGKLLALEDRRSSLTRSLSDRYDPSNGRLGSRPSSTKPGYIRGIQVEVAFDYRNAGRWRLLSGGFRDL